MSPPTPNPLIQDIHVLTLLPRQSEAYTLLCQAATLVYPVMRNHGWRIRRLQEFYPSKQPALLGMNENKGSRVFIRLRLASSRHLLYSLHDVVGTLLHELVHNDIAPHNTAFYQRLDAVWLETQHHVLEGYTGYGFFSKGMTLAAFTASVSPASPAQAARDAACRRCAAACAKALDMEWTCGVCGTVTPSRRLTCVGCLALTPGRFGKSLGGTLNG